VNNDAHKTSLAVFRERSHCSREKALIYACRSRVLANVCAASRVQCGLKQLPLRCGSASGQMRVNPAVILIVC
jgi:hypothetical protein